MDNFDHKILALLKQDARLSYTAIGKQIGLSSPAVTERVKKLESLGVITGYHARIDHKKMGQGIQAYIRLSVPYHHEQAVEKFLSQVPEVVRCHKLLGNDTFMLHVAFPDLDVLNTFIKQHLHQYGQTTTHVILGQAVVEQ